MSSVLGKALMIAFSSALVFAWNFSPHCVKPVDECQRFSPHEQVWVKLAYHEASRSSMDVSAQLEPCQSNNCVSCKSEIQAGGDCFMLMTRFVVVELVADLRKSARGIQQTTLILHPHF